MKYLKKKLYPRSMQRKVLLGFFLGFVAIILAFFITRYAFNDMLGTVEELAAPSEKLTKLNRVFQEIARLDQQQRADAIKYPQKSFADFLAQSQHMMGRVDSLMLLDWESPQLARIDSMKEILKDRDSLFFSYLKLKSNLIDNKSLTVRIDTLSRIIEKKKVEVDTSVITTQKKTTTTFIHDSTRATESKDERNFFGKLFGKKRKTAEETVAEPQVKVEEELSVSIDTVAISKHSKALEEVQKIVRDLETDQRLQNKRLIARELELIDANGLLIGQLLNILHEVEREEVQLMRQKSLQASSVVAESIQRISLLLLLFFLGAALLVYLIWVDISNSNFYKEQLEKARDEAEELSQIKQRFLANMSHEIRTPLQSILGFSEQIRKQKMLDRDAVDAIHSSSEHLLHIVNEVLDYSRISSGNFALVNEPFKLHAVIREIESALRIQTEKKGLTLLIDDEQSQPYTLSGDSFRLRQILYNVMGNAVKFTTKGFVKLTVTSTEVDDNVTCVFEISDSGIGIKPEDISKIFNQFEQANTSIERQFGGTGLGLTIVRSLIEAQGGNLQVTSQPGLGSTFTITLPFTKSLEQLHEDSTSLVSASSSSFTGKVLVVDDDPMILRLVGLILKSNDIPHVLYNDAEVLLHQDVDIEATHVLMDIRMPKISGTELCQALKKKYPPETMFVALTAHVFQQEKQALLDYGFDIVLTKPFHENDLLGLLGVTARLQEEAVEDEYVAAQYEIDLEPLRKMTMNDDALLQLIIEQFQEETSHDLAVINRCVEEGDLAHIREVIHKLAGRIGQIGILPLSQRLRDLEGRIKLGESFDEILPELTACISSVQQLAKGLQHVTLEREGK